MDRKIYDLAVIGGGASGMMAAISAAEGGAEAEIFEKNEKLGKKLYITGKGRGNLTNAADIGDFFENIVSNPKFLYSALYGFTNQQLLELLGKYGLATKTERGNRVFPVSDHASDITAAWTRALQDKKVEIRLNCGVKELLVASGEEVTGVLLDNGQKEYADHVIVATGGLSYPTTGSTGDGYRFAKSAGHSITNLFPSLTAIGPKAYKQTEDKDLHIDRSTPLSELGEMLCGLQLKNVEVRLFVGDTLAQGEFGDIDFTDGGIEGPVGFQVSRKAVKALVNGSKVSVVLDLKPGVPLTELTARVKELWQQVDKDPRSVRLHEKEKARIEKELQKAKKLNLPIYHRSDLLAEISNGKKECFIGYAGTHGKTTTSGMASYVLSKAGLNPSFVVGGIVEE